MSAGPIDTVAGPMPAAGSGRAGVHPPPRRPIPRSGGGGRAAALPTRLAWATLSSLALYVLIYVSFAWQLMGYPYEIDQGEGYDAWSAWLITQGQLPYTHNDTYPYYSSNYPPLWSAVVALPMSWTGPNLAPARGVSAAATLLAALTIGVAAGQITSARAGGGREGGYSGQARAPLLAGVLAAALFLASPYVFHTTALARVNSLALMFAVIAVALIETPTRSRIALCVLALLASLFTKPTAIDAVVACLGFLLFIRPLTAVWAGTALAGLGLVGLGALIWLTQGAFWSNVVLGNANPFDFAELGKYVVNFGIIHAIVLVLAGAEALRACRSGAWSPWVLYLPLAGLMALTVGKWGAGESYFLPLIAATSVLAGTRLAHLLTALARNHPQTQPSPSSGKGGWSTNPIALRGFLLPMALAAQMLLFAHGPISDAISVLPDLGRQAEFLGHVPSAEDRAKTEEIVQIIRQAEGSVLSEAPSFAVAAGKPVVGNATHLRNLYESGLWKADALVADIRGHRFHVIVLNAQLYPSPILAAIGGSYYLAHEIRVESARYHVFLPGHDAVSE